MKACFTPHFCYFSFQEEFKRNKTVFGIGVLVWVLFYFFFLVVELLFSWLVGVFLCTCWKFLQKTKSIFKTWAIHCVPDPSVLTLAIPELNCTACPPHADSILLQLTT